MKSLKITLLIAMFLFSFSSFAFAIPQVCYKHPNDVRCVKEKLVKPTEKSLFSVLGFSDSVSYISRGGPEDYCRKTGGVWSKNKCIKKEE